MVENEKENIYIGDQVRQAAEKISTVETLLGCMFILNIDCVAMPQIRNIIARRIAHHGGVTFACVHFLIDHCSFAKA